METPLRSRHLICFGAFEFDPHTGELRRHGMKLKLQGHAIDALAILLEHPGELVTREELQKRLWSADTFVDFEHSLNAAVKRLREVLDDSAERPRFIETLPRHGYRFIAPLNNSLAPDLSTQQTGEKSSSLHSEPSSAGREMTARSGTSENDISPQNEELRLGRSRQGRVSPYKIGVLAAGLLVGFAVVVIALNVWGLRDRLLPAFWGRHSVSTPRIESIAVLPLENLSGDKEQEYFADGMTEALITDLGKIGALRVISRTSVMQYKGTKKPLPQIARELNVDAIVEGTVQRSGNRVRITANLLHAPSDRHLWAETYERDLRNVLALQDEVARAIASEIQIKVKPQEQIRLTSTRQVNPEAYEFYLQGQYHYYKWRPDEFQKAIAFFQKAIEADPKWAPAYVGLANSYGWLWMEGALPPQEVLPRFNAALSTAMEIDDTLPEVRYTLAVRAFYYLWDWGEAEREFKRALALNPNLVEARYEYAWFLSSMGRIAESLTEAKRAVERDPLSVTANLALGSMYSMARQYDQAIPQLRHTIELEPNDPRGYGFLAGAYEQTGMYEEAVAAHQKAMTLSGAQPAEVAALRRAYSQSGYQGYLIWFLGRQNDPYFSAVLHTRLGHKDDAFVGLEKAYKQHRWEMIQLKVRPVWDPLRSDPRFQDLLRRMNFPP
jgi:TolB-like protein/DNA-binding winged helix-turn-helix (wHTH) protein